MKDHPALILDLGRSGRTITGSKVYYSRTYPDHFTIFGAGICLERGGLPDLIWYGDLDLTRDEPKLVAAAKEIGEALFVLNEWDRPDLYHGSRGEVLGRAELLLDIDGWVAFDERRVHRDNEGQLRLDLHWIEINALEQQVEMWRFRARQLDKLVLRGVEQGWLRQEDRDEALLFPEGPQ